MKYSIIVFFIVIGWSLSSQNKEAVFIEVHNFKGTIVLHNPNILHLREGRPSGVILSWNKKTFGEKAWQQYYNFPDYGFSLIYQNMKNEVLGDNYSLLAHYNFYFLKRQFVLRTATGLAFNTNPYDRLRNPKNIAYGSKLLSNSYLMLNYKKERLFDRIGFHMGISFIHYSNANVKAPNTSTNTFAFNLGFVYDFLKKDPEYFISKQREKFTQPITFNFVFRTGINSSDLIGSEQFPFYIFSAYADKRLNRKTAIQFGSEVFFSRFLKEYIKFRTIAFDLDTHLKDADYRRVGLFIGHELFLNKLSIITQVGYYAYYPFDFEGRTYLRFGLKRYFDDQWFASITLKSHAAKAESAALGIGIRL